MVDSAVNTVTGEIVTEDEYVDMILREYEEAEAFYRQAREGRERARMVLYKYMDDQGSNGIPSETYHVRRKSSYDYTKNKAGFLPLMEILNPADLARVYIEPGPADGTWSAQRIKALAEIYPQINEVLERVREARVVLEFQRREDGK